MQEYIDLKVDFAKRNAQLSGMTLESVVVRSYDTAIKFRIEIADHVLDDTYDVKILSKYSTSNLKVMNTLKSGLEIADGKIIYTPKVNLITEADYVRNFLYLSKDGLGLDMAQFNYEVDVSQIGEVAVEVKQVYDESYETLITEFEQALEDYKLTLPQADSVRAEIDVILNQFGVDSQAKLNQFDTDAQQAIADNQTAFELAETGRQDTYEQAETVRNQSSNQAVVDWEQGADALVDSKLIEIQTDTSTLINGAIDDFNQRGDAEIADWREYADVELEDYLADKMVINNSVTNGDFSDGTTRWIGTFGVSTVDLSVANKILSAPITNIAFGGIRQNTDVTYNAGDKIYQKVRYRVTNDDCITIRFSNGGTVSGGATYIVNSSVSENVWYEQSHLHTLETGSGYLFLQILNYYVDTATAKNKVLETDYIMAINLTETFGAGNEPTKSEMDELIKITGYFDEITLTKIQLLNWQLKLMRQNRNALIALGGTII